MERKDTSSPPPPPLLQGNSDEEGAGATAEALECLLDGTIMQVFVLIPISWMMASYCSCADALLGFDQGECQPSGIDGGQHNKEGNNNRVETGVTASTTAKQGSSSGFDANLKFDPLRSSRTGRKKERSKQIDEAEKKKHDVAADSLEHLLKELSVEAGSMSEGSMRDTLAALAATGPGREAEYTDEEEEEEEDDPLSSALVDSIMRQLLSKDVLYEPMKEIGEQYPPWLSKNRDTLEPEEYGRYERQYAYIQKICAMYENEPDNYSGLMCLLQEMQQCGQPPQEIIDHVGPPGDSAAVSGAFGSQNQECPMM